MALNGSFNTSSYYSSSKEDYISLRFSWTATQNLADNTSTITWELRGDRAKSGYVMAGNFKVVIDGDTVYEKNDAYRIQLYNNTLVASGTKKITHTATGARSFSVTVNGAIYYDNRNVSGTKNFTLDTIPRKATINTAPNFNDTENPTITYSNLAGNSVEALDACISLTGAVDNIKYRPISKTGTSYTFTLTEAEKDILYSNTLDGKDNRTVYFYIRTTIGGVTYHDSVVRTFRVIDSAADVTATIRDIGLAVPVTNNAGNTVVKGLSTVSYSINATAKKGASITSYSIEHGGKSYNTATGNIYNIVDGTFIVTIKDNRGIEVKQTYNKEFVNYFKPTCTIKTLDTDTATGKLSFEIAGTFFNDKFGVNGMQNFLEYSYQVTDSNGNIVSSELKTLDNSDISANNYSKTITLTGLDYRETYKANCYVVDAIDEMAQGAELILKILPIFDWGESDFNFNVPVSINGETISDFVVDYGNSGNWTYRLWSSGVAECWRTLTFSTNFDETWGTMYQSHNTITAQSYPLTFTSVPVETVTLTGKGGYAAWIYALSNGANTTTQSGYYKLCRPSAVSASTEFYVNYYIRGRYK
jgi:hypothetical protein